VGKDLWSIAEICDQQKVVSPVDGRVAAVRTLEVFVKINHPHIPAPTEFIVVNGRVYQQLGEGASEVILERIKKLEK